jgi:hypothetical protein
MIGAIFAGLTSLGKLGGGFYLASGRSKGAAGAEVEAWMAWGVKMRRHAASLRLRLADKGEDSPDPPPFPGQTAPPADPPQVTP